MWYFFAKKLFLYVFFSRSELDCETVRILFMRDCGRFYAQSRWAIKSSSTAHQFMKSAIDITYFILILLYERARKGLWCTLSSTRYRYVSPYGMNYLFCGNHEAVQNMAVVCSLLATCRNQNVNPMDYLNDVIRQMPYHTKASHEELLQLLPYKWKLTHPESVMNKTTW